MIAALAADDGAVLARVGEPVGSWLWLAAVSSGLAVLLWPRPSRYSAARTILEADRHRSAGASYANRRSAIEGSQTRADVREIAAAMVLLAVALRSGLDVIGALERVVAVGSPAVRRDLRPVVAALRWGIEDRSAWAGAPPGWRRLELGLRLARQAGAAPSQLLIDSARELSAERATALEEAAARLGVHLVVPLGLAFLPAFVLTTIVPLLLAVAADLFGRGPG